MSLESTTLSRVRPWQPQLKFPQCAKAVGKRDCPLGARKSIPNDPFCLAKSRCPFFRAYARLADTSDDFHSNWDTVALVLGSAATPLTLQEIRDAWPPGVTRRHDATLWRWLDRAVELGLAERSGRGTRVEPFRYGLALNSH